MERELVRLRALAYSVLRDPEMAADVAQDVMERALRHSSSLREPGSLSAWLATACVRRALRVRRRARLIRWLPLADASKDTTPLVVPDLDLDRALAQLSDRQRAVVALHYGYGYTLDEVARTLACQPGTARSHLARALTALRKELIP